MSVVVFLFLARLLQCLNAALHVQTTELTYRFIVFRRVELVGVGPARHYKLSVAMYIDQRGETVLTLTNERRDGLRLQFAGRPRTSVVDVARLFMWRHCTPKADRQTTHSSLGRY